MRLCASSLFKFIRLSFGGQLTGVNNSTTRGVADIDLILTRNEEYWVNTNTTRAGLRPTQHRHLPRGGGPSGKEKIITPSKYKLTKISENYATFALSRKFRQTEL